VRSLQASDLMTLEEYHKARIEFRAKVLAHKKDRQVSIGPNMTLYFEDWLTIKYQVQEMLRIERIFESEAIEEELNAYVPLIPDGSNFKATFMIEFPDPAVRHRELAQLIGVEDKVYIQASGYDRVYAIADEDLERANEEKTSAVHFLRFELDPEMVKGLKNSVDISFGITHPNYQYSVRKLPETVRAALVADLV